MNRDDSPDYSAPRDRRFTPPSPVYTAPSGGRFSSRDSPDYCSSSERRSRSPGTSRRSRSPVRYERSQSPARGATRWSGLSPEDEETLRSLYCRRCGVEQHDQDSMLAHIRGKPHLAQLKRLQDRQLRERTAGLGLSEVLRADSQLYDEKFWDREKGHRRLRPEQERFLDTKRLNNVPAKFDRDNYDHGQFKYSRKELYCEPCDVWVRSRDQMQAHKEGANHRKKTARVPVFECKLCLIKVPCQATLNSHMKGKDHIKRANQLQETRRLRGELTEGYRTGPLEMARLMDDEREELGKLRRENEILKKKVQQYHGEIRKCVREHGTTELNELRQQVKFCRENHARPSKVKEEEDCDVKVKTESGPSKIKEEEEYFEEDCDGKVFDIE